MNLETPSLHSLARRVQEGDSRARLQMHAQLEPNLVRIVRRVLSRGRASTRLERKILAAAQRLAPSATDMAQPVAHNLCEMVVTRLFPGATEAPWEATTTAGVSVCG